MEKDLNQLAKTIIDTNQYMTIASVDEHNNPWASTVAYVYDGNYNFYWVSVPESLHQKNIAHNPKIVFSIFDSHQKWGEGVGVQIEAIVTKVDLRELPKATECYFSRDYPYGNVLGAFGKGLENLIKGKIYHFYKATPTKVWVPDPDADVDARVEVNL